MNIPRIANIISKGRRAHPLHRHPKGTTRIVRIGGTNRTVRTGRKSPAFIVGMARIFDFTGSMNRRKRRGSGFEADAASLYSDWRAVGDDIRTGVRHFEIQEADLMKARR